MSQINFDASQVKPAEGALGAIPAGWYNVSIAASDMKAAKTPGNYYLELQLQVMDGQYAGRKVFTRLNIRNSNPVAQEIAYGELSAICHAVGVLQVADSQQLHGRPFKVKVSVQAATTEFEAGNNIRAYKNINEVVDQVPAPGAPAAAWAPPPPAAAAPAAWAPPHVATPAAVPVAPAWAPPAAPQPWAQAPAPIAPPAPSYAPPAPPAAPAYAPPAAAAPSAPAVPPWMNAPAPGAAPGAAGAPPPWATAPAA